MHKLKYFSYGICFFLLNAVSDNLYAEWVGDRSDNNFRRTRDSIILGKDNRVYGSLALGIGSNNISGWYSADIDNINVPIWDPFALDKETDFILNKDKVVELTDSQPHNRMVVVGGSNIALGEKSTALGNHNAAFGSSSVSVGKSNFASGDASQAIGDFNTSKGFKSSAFGYRNVIDESRFSYAFGGFNHVLSSAGLGFGSYNTIKSDFSYLFGFGNKTLENSKFSGAIGFLNEVGGNASNAFGAKNIIEGETSLAIGTGNNIQGRYSISIGLASVIGNDDSILNRSTLSRYEAISNGNVVRTSYGIAIGNNINLIAENTVAIGNSIVSNNSPNSIIVGNESIGQLSEQFLDPVLIPFGDIQGGAIDVNNNWSGKSILSNGTLSIGAPDKERQIKHVATGAVTSTSTDAINGSQLYAAIKSIGDVPIRLQGNMGEGSLKLGGSVFIKGEANYSDTNNGTNIATKIESGTVLIGLKRDLIGLTSINFDNETSFNSDGIRIGNDGLTFTRNHVDVGGNRISRVNVAQDPDQLDAANVKFVLENYQKLKNLGYTFVTGELKEKFEIGSEISIMSDSNLNTSVSRMGVLFGLNRNIQNIDTIEIFRGPIINKNYVSFGENLKFGIDGITVSPEVKLNESGLLAGNIVVDASTGRISGISDPIHNNDAVNKGYVLDKLNLVRGDLNELVDKPIIVETNRRSVKKKLGDVIKIKGSDSNENLNISDYEDNSILTWIDSDVLRIGVRKELRLTKFIAELNDNSIELNNNSIIFKSIDKLSNTHKLIALNVTSNGTADSLNNTTRLKINEVDLANVNDGFVFQDNLGTKSQLGLNKKLTIIGNASNINTSLFDDGTNILTSIFEESDGIKYQLSLKKSPEFESLTLNGSQTETPKLILRDQSGNKKITLNINNGNGEVTVASNLPNKSSRLTYDGLYLNDQSGNSKLSSNEEGTGSVDSLDSNKRRLTHSFNYKGVTKTEEIATLEDGLIFNGNVRSGNGATKLNKTVNISGADSNKNWDEFDNGENIMTKVESNNGETVIRIAMRKNLKVKNGEIGGSGSNGELKLKDKDGNEGITLNPDKIIFNNISKLDKDGNLKKNGSAGITMTQNGKPNLVDKGPATRILITDDKGNAIDEVATMKDGLKFGANIGGEKSNLLNSKVVVSGNKNNTDWSKFDDGSNIMTNIDQSSEGQTNITIALKRDLELDSATFGHGTNIVEGTNTQKVGKDGYIKVVNKEGKTAIVIDGGNTSNDVGPSITVSDTKSVGGGDFYII